MLPLCRGGAAELERVLRGKVSSVGCKGSYQEFRRADLEFGRKAGAKERFGNNS